MRTTSWDYDLAQRGSLNFLELPNQVGFAKINCSIADFEEDYYSWTHYPVGTILVTTNTELAAGIKQPYLEKIDGPLLPMDFLNFLFAGGGKFTYEVTIASEYRNDLGGTDEFTFNDEQILTDPSLFHWSKIIMSTTK